MLYYLLFQLTNKIRLLKHIMAITTLYTLKQTKLRIAPVALLVTDVSRLLRSA